MQDASATKLKVRMFETDAQGHLMGSAYVSYANQALWDLLRSAGIDVDDMLRSGVGPVVLETNIKYRRELRAGDEVSISCALQFGEGKTYVVECIFHNAAGEVSAEVRNINGLMDLTKRRLLSDPSTFWRDRAANPGALGL